MVLKPTLNVVPMLWQVPQAADALEPQAGVVSLWHTVAQVLPFAVKVMVPPTTLMAPFACRAADLIAVLPAAVSEWHVSQERP